MGLKLKILIPYEQDMFKQPMRNQKNIIRDILLINWAIKNKKGGNIPTNNHI